MLLYITYCHTTS